MEAIPEWIALSIHNTEGAWIKLWTWDNILVKDLKALIVARGCDVPGDKQKLTLENDTLLYSERLLTSYGIRHHSRIYLEILPQKEIVVFS